MKIACVAVFCLFAIWHANGQGNPCLTDNGGCQQMCTEAIENGMFVVECSCTNGYSLNEDGKNCDPGTCWDNIKNQQEDDVDCGGPDCARCECFNNSFDSGEKDVDCGGPSCAPCACFDNIKSSGEEDVDCGGPSCYPCGYVPGSGGGGASETGSGGASETGSGGGSAPAPPTFGLCNNPIWNKGKGKGKCNWKYPMLQRYSHDKQGDVCLRNPNKDDYMPPGPGLKEWKCPKGCKKVKGPPFCEDKENKGDACRVPLPGGGPSEETSAGSGSDAGSESSSGGGSVVAPCCTNWEPECYDVSNANNNNLACEDFVPNTCLVNCVPATNPACSGCCTSVAAAAAWNCHASGSASKN